MTSDQDKFFKFIDDSSHAEAFISRLEDAVRIPSVSDPNDPHRTAKDVERMGTWLADQLKAVGVNQVNLVKLPDDPETKLPLPPLVTGRVDVDSTNRKTVLVYGHYDVQPANLEQWKEINGPDTDPFVPVRLPVDQPVKIVGRGSTDDKGPVTGWLNVLQAHKELGIKLPVNVRFLFEGMEEQGSTGLETWIKEEVGKPDSFFHGVDCVCITDNYWLTTRRPTLTYGTRGIATFSIKVTGAKNDLHSGIYGRMVHEPMTDLIKLLGKLVDTTGKIIVKGVEELVPLPTEEEENEYRNMDYTVNDLAKDTGTNVELSDDPVKLLMGRMRYPSLSIHGIDGAAQGTIIPHRVTGRFSLRLAKPQTPEEVKTLVEDFLYAEFDKFGSRNTMEVIFGIGALPWVGDKDHWSFKAADAATQNVHGSQLAPYYTREGGTLPLALVFEEQLKTNVMLLPMGRSDDGAHSLSEKLDIDNYIKGTKVFGAYLHEVANVR